MTSSIERMLARLPWRRRKAMKLTHQNALRRLQSLGFAPATVYDIGAYRAGWTRLASEIFPSAEFVLFEANADNAAALAGRRHFIAALGAEDGARPFHVPRAGDVTGASLYRENTAHYADRNLAVRMVETARLDGLVAKHGLPPPDLIKIDVQGAELDVIAGGKETFGRASALIAELSLVDYNKGAPLMAEMLAAIDAYGFRCVDICELHRTEAGFVLQMDLVFANAELFRRYGARAGVGD